MEVTEKGYVMLARCCCKIQVLRMYACAGVNDAVLKACGRFLQQLTVIDACGAHLLTDQGAQVSALPDSQSSWQLTLAIGSRACHEITCSACGPSIP